MAWVIVEPCTCNQYAKCLEHCPERCIETAEGEDQYYIDPDRCTSCGACDLACPVAAIFPEDAVPDQWISYVAKNRDFFQRVRSQGAGVSE